MVGALPAASTIPARDPMEWKLELAHGIIARWHGEDAARAAEEHFTRVASQGQAPEEVDEADVPSIRPRRIC